MAKQTESLTHFPELSSSELHRISGGDWWSDFIGLFPNRERKSGNNNHKIE